MKISRNGKKTQTKHQEAIYNYIIHLFAQND